MARRKTIPRAARFAQLMQSAQSELKLAVELLGDTQKALTIWAAELSPDVENLKQTAIGVQAEAIRTALHAQSMRAVAERLSVVSQLLTDEGGSK